MKPTDMEALAQALANIDINDGYENPEPVCGHCGVAGCDCDSDCLNCGSRDPNHRCD